MKFVGKGFFEPIFDRSQQDKWKATKTHNTGRQTQRKGLTASRVEYHDPLIETPQIGTPGVQEES